MGLLLPSLGHAQRQSPPQRPQPPRGPQQSHVQQQLQAAELVGTWAGRVAAPSPAAASTAPNTAIGQRLILRADSTYVWLTAGERPTPPMFQHWRAMRGDTLALDTARSYTVVRRGPALWLTAIGAAETGTVFRFERDWTTTPLTGHVLPCRHGRIQTFACRNVELLSYLPLEALGGAAGTDVWGWHDSTTGREFLITGGYFGGTTAFVEVTDPRRPRYLGTLLPSDSAVARANGRQSVKVYQHYALITYDRHAAKPGLQIVDLSQLRTVQAPTLIRETTHYDGIDYALTVAVNPATGFLYINDSNTCGGGVHMLDLRTPTAPVFAGCYTVPQTDSSSGGSAEESEVNDAQCVLYRGPDRAYWGREICAVFAGQHVVLADVTDKQHPTTLSRATYPQAVSTNQGWFTADQRNLFLDDEFDESARAGSFGIDSLRSRTIGLDLTDLEHPVLLTEFVNPNSWATDHNLHIRGRYLYQGNYGAGLRILDLADPKAPSEVGYFSPRRNDVSDNAYKTGSGGWGGPRAWGTYPFLQDNSVVAVSLSTGLALIRLRRSQPVSKPKPRP